MKMIKRLLLFLMVACVALGMWTVSASADNVSETRIVFDGKDDSFKAGYDNEWSGNDLFMGLKHVLPGDIVKQRIEVSCMNIEGYQARIYIRGLGAHKGDEDFLKKLHMKVEAEDGKVLFEGGSDKDWAESDDLSEWSYLCTLQGDAAEVITVTLEVPTTLTEEYAIGKLDWQLKADKIPIPDDDARNIKTGDDARNTRTGDITMIGTWLAILVLSAVVLFILFKVRRKEKE